MAGTVITPPTAAVIQPRTIILQPMPVQKSTTDYESKASTILGSIQIAAVVLILLLCGATHLTSYSTSYMTLAVTSASFSSLIFFCLSGGFAIGAAKRHTACLVISHMIMAIFASMAATLLIGLSCAQLIIVAMDVDYSSDYYSYNNDDYYNEYDSYGQDDLGDWLSTTTPAPFIAESRPSKNEYRYQNMAIVLYVSIIVLSLLEFIITIWGSSLACRAMCCPKTNVVMYGQVEPGQLNTVTMGNFAMPPVSATGQLPMMQANPLPEMEALKEDSSPKTPPPPYE